MPQEVGCFDHADGSCRWSEYDTYVIVSVFGPRHVDEKKSSHDPRRGAIEVRCKMADRGASDRVVFERQVEEYASALFNRIVDLSQFARQVVTVAILVVLGKSAAAAINASVAALVDAEIPFAEKTVSITEPANTTATLSVTSTAENAFRGAETHGGPTSLEDLNRAMDACATKMRRTSDTSLFIFEELRRAAAAAAPA